MGSINCSCLLSTYNYWMMLFILLLCVLQASHGSPTREEQSGNETEPRLEDFSRNGYSCETNEYDKKQWCLCKPGEKVYKISSVHSNSKEDRKWTLECRQIQPQFIVPNVNPWYQTSEENWWDGDIDWNGLVPKSKNSKIYNHGFLVGMTSRHWNKKEDRKYRFFSTHNDDWYTTDCTWHTDINDWDDPLLWKLGDEEVIRGLRSRHWNKKEDRRWSIQVCKLRKKCTEISKIEYQTARSEVSTEVVFGGRSQYNNTRGLSDNSYTVEISQTTSNSLAESYEFSQTSGHTNEVSMSVTAGVTASVPGINEYSLEVSVGASHSWSFEESWTRSNSKEYSEENGRTMSWEANCKAGCFCRTEVVVKTAKGVIPYLMRSQSVDGVHQCIERGELTIENSFDGTATSYDEC